MCSEILSEDKKLEEKINKSGYDFQLIKSKYIIQKIFSYLQKKVSYEIIKYNKKIQNRLDISLKDYKDYYEIYSDIELIIIPDGKNNGKFINIINKEDDPLFHVYFNDSKEEIDKN